MKICCSVCQNVLDHESKLFVGRLINEMNSLAAQLITMNERLVNLKKLRPSKTLSQATIDSNINVLSLIIDESTSRHNELRNMYLSIEPVVFMPYGKSFAVQKS